jgi:outer membrane usher protein
MACAGAALGRTSLMMMLCFCSATGRAQQDDDLLPPPPDAQAINQQGVYHLALVVNHYETGLVIPVQRRDGGLWASSADLQRGGIPVDKLPQGDIALASLPESEYRYDSVNQKLLLTVPKEWVPEREVTFGNGNPRVVARSGQGALLNYDFYANSTEGGTRQASVWHELRFFNDTGSLSSTGTVRQNLGGADGQPRWAELE